MALHLIIDCIGIAVLAGLVYGIFGGGSGLIMTPGFYYVLRHFSLTQAYQMQMAIATTAFATGVIGIASVRAQFKHHNIDMSVVKSTYLGVGIGTLAAVSLLNVVPSMLLKHIFGVVVIIVAFWLGFYKQHNDTKSWSLTGFIHQLRCFVIGLLWFLLGIAVFTVPYLHKCGLDMRRSVGCATFTGVIFSLIAGILLMTTGIVHTGVSLTHVGFVNVLLFAIVLIPSAWAASWGAHLSHKLPQQHLRLIYSGLIGLVGLLMLICTG